MTDPFPWSRNNNKHAQQSAMFKSQTFQKYTLPWAHKKRQNIQTCSKVCLFFSHSEGAPSLPGAPSSATLSDKWGRPQVQRSNMLFQDRKRKKSPGQLLRIWWQTPFPEAETTTMHSKVLYPSCKERSQAKNYLWTKYARQPMYVVCFHLCSFKIIVYFSLLR